MTRWFLIFLCSTASVWAGEPWPNVRFAEVRAFAWPDDEETGQVILPRMKLKPGAINKEGAKLTSEQTQQLRKAVSGKHPYYLMAACHIPHNAFVFFDADKKPVAFVEICFGCCTNRISPKGAARYIDVVALAAIFDAHKLPLGGYRDLAAFRKDFDSRPKPK